jgi:choline dehydrogenase-like flavoprotein
MEIENLASFGSRTVFEPELVIVGGGPVGLTIAREFLGTSTSVLVLESGLLEETPDHAELAELESVGEPRTEAQKQKRISFHGASWSSWSQESQPFGVRCRALGGSSHAWAGKSAAFEPIDFIERCWIPYSGWPIDGSKLEPFVERARRAMNLGQIQPEPRFDAGGLRSFYWQFARSRRDPLDILRFGSEFVALPSANVRVLLNATVTQIKLTDDTNSFKELDISTIDGVVSRVKARVAVIATGGIENARLLLTSNKLCPDGIGNRYDVVGRFLMDHPGARVGRFPSHSITKIVKRFGFLGVKTLGRMDMFMHGLALTPELQKREELANAAVYFMMERAPDDPWDALRRLLRRRSKKPLHDLYSTAAGATLIAKGLGTRLLASEATPKSIKDFIVNTAIRFSPDFVADEFQTRGVPHKLTGISIDAITEQRPNPDSRVTLSRRLDRLDLPMAKVDWRIDDRDRGGLVRIAKIVREVFPRHGLPQPLLEDWIVEDRANEGAIIDMAHTLGTTRMSDDPRRGVVDRDCQVHAVKGLYIAGGSVFPTSGHANPTLMMLSLAIRLADTLKSRLSDQ